MTLWISSNALPQNHVSCGAGAMRDYDVPRIALMTGEQGAAH
jgi:hypothetical protein